MPKKTFTPEQIVAKLRQIEVAVGQGKTVPLACKEAGIVEQTFYRWRKEYGGLQVEQARKLKELFADAVTPRERIHVNPELVCPGLDTVVV
jgi:putative transposase